MIITAVFKLITGFIDMINWFIDLIVPDSFSGITGNIQEAMATFGWALLSWEGILPIRTLIIAFYSILGLELAIFLFRTIGKLFLGKRSPDIE